VKDTTARSWAVHYGATVLPYQQKPATCAAVCALWIRKQLKNGSIFGSEKRLWRAPEASSKTLFKADEDFEYDKIDVLRIYIRKHDYSGKSVEKNYIKEGSRSPGYSKGFKEIKEDRHIAEEFFEAIKKTSITEKGRGILKIFDQTSVNKCISSIGYDMKDQELGREFAHAVALDCTKPDFAFIFASSKKSVGFFWFWKCPQSVI